MCVDIDDLHQAGGGSQHFAKRLVVNYESSWRRLHGLPVAESTQSLQAPDKLMLHSCVIDPGAQARSSAS